MHPQRLGLGLVVMVISGCAKPAGPVIVSGAPQAVVTNQGSEVALTRTMAVASGAKLKLQFVTAINPDCTTIGPAVARAIKQPSRGTLTIKSADDFVYFPPANPRSVCNAKRVQGTLVEYQPPVGFKGTETLAYDVFNSGGAVAHHSITVNVM
jgi:hypothetical protein